MSDTPLPPPVAQPPTRLVVATANVNGLRAAARKGFLDWWRDCRADIVCLQEVRCRSEELPVEVTTIPGWHLRHECGPRAGHAGVAILTRQEPRRVVTELGGEQTGRYLELEVDTRRGPLTVVSVYVPTGEAGTPRQLHKEKFLGHLADRLAELRAEGREVTVCGDINIAHTEADLKNWRGNRTRAGFLPEERAWLDRLYGELGWVDVVRHLQPQQSGPYSWWSYRGRAFDNDAGWRIDVHISSPALAAAAVWARTDRADSYDTRWSDHAPVVVGYA
ncbi:MAG: exodeoxyribonuclease III [Actinomycetes bacterium]